MNNPLKMNYQKVGLWMVLLGISFILQGPKLWISLYPPEGNYLDFVQEWLSARNYWTGHPVYEHQLVAMERHTGDRYTEETMAYAWNAHPPASVLVALPFGGMSNYHFAHFLWNFLSLSLFLIAAWLIAMELDGKRSWEWWGGFLLVLLWAFPITSHLAQGQLNFVLTFLIVLGWRADRREKPGFAGLAWGTAIGLKLFPGLILVYLAFSRRWRTLLATLATVTLWQLAALAVLGRAEIEHYLTIVLPTVEGFRLSLYNYSLAGLFDRWGQELAEPLLFLGLRVIAQLLVVGFLICKAWHSTELVHRDRALCLAVVGMPLLSPVAWGHYLVLLLLPVFWLASRLSNGLARLGLLGLIVLYSLPDYYFVKLTWQGEQPPEFNSFLEPLHDWLLCSEPFTIGLLVLFFWITLSKTSPRKVPVGHCPEAVPAEGLRIPASSS